LRHTIRKRIATRCPGLDSVGSIMQVNKPSAHARL
jgi:hypothetical protein